MARAGDPWSRVGVWPCGVASYAVGPTARTVVGPSAACCIRRFKRVDCVASPIVGRSMAVSKLPFRKRKYRKLVAMLAAVAFGIFAVLALAIVGLPLLVVSSIREAVQWIRTPKQVRLRRKNAVKTAMEAFRNQAGDRPHWGTVLQEESDRCIVCVCYGNTKPPRRAYFAVANETLACEVLEGYKGDTRVWR